MHLYSCRRGKKDNNSQKCIFTCLIFLPVTSTVKVVELDPARFVAVASYVPASDTPIMPDLVRVELAFGALRSLFIMVTRSAPSVRDIEVFWIQVISSSAKLKLENEAVRTKSSLTPTLMFSLPPATGGAAKIIKYIDAQLINLRLEV